MSPGVVLRLFEPEAPDLASYDLVLVNSSGGKDSQACLEVTVAEADAAGVPRDRLVVVHADLGRVEWPGTVELAAEHAAHYGLRFETVVNRNWADLLARVRARGRWPSAQARYCTSEFKTTQCRRAMTALVRELGLTRPARILNVLGMRAAESPARAKLPAFAPEPAASTQTTRHVDRWLPIHHWTTTEVWARIDTSGTRHHWAYDQGLPRLSCSFCVLASRSALIRAAQERPGLAAEYAEVEAEIGHRFRADLSMADVIQLAQHPTANPDQPIKEWTA